MAQARGRIDGHERCVCVTRCVCVGVFVCMRVCVCVCCGGGSHPEKGGDVIKVYGGVQVAQAGSLPRLPLTFIPTAAKVAEGV